MPEECQSCHAAIDWCVKFPEEFNDAGLPKTIPVNRDSWNDPAGNIAAWRGKALPLKDGSPGPSIIYARYITKAAPLKDGEHRGISHFATCPDAGKWRNRRRGQ